MKFLSIDFDREWHDSMEFTKIIFAIFIAHSGRSTNVFDAWQRNILRILEAGNNSILVSKENRGVVIRAFD